MIVRVSTLVGFVALLGAAASGALASGNIRDAGWPTYGADYANTRYTRLSQIDRTDVARLGPVWRYVLGPHERVESTPIVVGNTMYVTTGVGNNVVALDARTGAERWRYRPTLGFMSPCCGALNRGVAFLGGRVFVATLDAQLIALDARSGKPLWHISVGDAKRGLSETMAPLAWNGMVFIGSSGSDYGIRGSLSAYRAGDGKLLWRWYSVSQNWQGAFVREVHGVSLHRDVAAERAGAPAYRNAWRSGGGAVWMTPALDAKAGVIYASTGNPAPVFDGSVRPGDNLYTDSIVALNARTGKMLWYYQQTPHDVWEYEAASPPVLFETRGGHSDDVPAVAEAGKTRWLYVLKRSDGSLIRLSESWSPNADVYDAPPHGASKGTLPLRGTIGPISFDPSRRLAIVNEIERPESQAYWSDETVAVDVDTGRIVWKKRLGPRHTSVRGDPVLAGSLSAGDIVFVSDPEGRFYALDAGTGNALWEYQLGAVNAADQNATPFSRWMHVMHDWLQPLKRKLLHQPPPTPATAGVDSNPIAYTVDGREYVAIGFDSEPERASGGAVISAFALPER